jgi:hypothetical protein
MPPILDKSNYALLTYLGYNSASDLLQALFAHINQDDEFELDMDLYFKTLVVKHC